MMTTHTDILTLAFFNFSPWEIGIIAFIILLLFGAKRLPELARGLGKSLKEFKSATSEVEKEFKNAMEEEGDESKKPAEEQKS